MDGVIYKITSPSGKIYIGQTICFYKRMNRYKNHSCKAQIKLYASFVKWGFDKHEVQILESNINCPHILNEMEIFYINKYNSMNEGLNLISGGGCGVKRSLETIEKMRKASMGNKNNVGKKNALGYKHTDEAKLKISSALKGRTSPSKGKKLTDEHILKISESKFIEVYQFSLEGQFIQKFSSMKLASEMTGISKGSITNAVKGIKQKTAGGFIWKKQLN